MAIWSYTDRWEVAPLYRKNHDGIAVVCGTSPWLTADIPPHWFRIGVNGSRTVLPIDAWVGMDEPETHGIEAARAANMKFYRGTFSEMRIGSIPVKLLPNSYFIDVSEKAQPLPVVKNDAFLWLSSGIIVAIQLAMYMGYSRIVLNGVDFEDAGKYIDGSKCANAAIQQGWYDGLAAAVVSIAETAKEWGFQFYSTRDNRLNLPHYSALLDSQL